MKPITIALLLLLPFCFHRIAAADFLTVVNPSFEDISGQSPFNEFTFGPPNGWQLHDPGSITGGGAGNTFFVGTLTPTAPIYFTNGASDGQRVGIAFNYFGSGGQGQYGLQQTLAATLQANTSYTLQVDIGNIASGTSIDGTFFPLTGFPGYRVELLAGGQIIAADNNTLSGAIAEGTFSTSTLQFSTGASPLHFGESLGIRLINLNLIDPSFPNSDIEVDFDNVRLSAVTAVPEPATYTLVTIMALGFVIQRLRQGSLHKTAKRFPSM